MRQNTYTDLLMFGTFIEGLYTTSVYIIGDLNADVSDDHSLFSAHMHNVCGDIDLVVSDEAMLPNNSFTYVSEAHHTVSRLGHCLSTADAHQSIENIVIKYDLDTTDHLPVCVTLDVNNIPMLATQTMFFFSISI